MTQENTKLQNNKTRLWTKAIQAISMTALLVAMVLANGISASAQFTFMGDYDKSFAAPNGYYVDPEDVDPTIDDYQTLFYSGELLPDSSIIAGGRHVDGSPRGDFYLRKFTPSGAVNAAFGTNGFVRTTFFIGVNGSQLSYSNDIPTVLKVQPDGKILLAGVCSITSPDVVTIPTFGTDACVMRYNADGSVDASFGNASVMTGGGLNSQGTQNPTYSFPVGAGRFMTQTGVLNYPGNPGPRRGTGGRFYDMAIQPDGKIVLVGETQNEHNSSPGIAAFILRLNANGTRDDSFGINGIVQMAAAPTVFGCYPGTGFQSIRLQTDGRIITAGYTSVVRDDNLCFQGKRFAVTRWTANGQAETLRYLDNITTYNAQQEGALSILFTRDGSRVLVSGVYKDLNPSGYQAPTMVRLNLSDLSLDTTFGTGGIRQYNGCASVFCTPSDSGLRVKAIQPDGKILGTDGGPNSGNVVRFNADGSSDQSFGNLGINGADNGRGRLRAYVTHFNGISNQIVAGQILVRPNGRINLIGYSAAHAGQGILRAAVSQQNTLLKSGVYSDFTNDGKSELAVFRPSGGFWHQLDSANNNYSVFQWGISSDKPAPADYDGDGKTDRAVFRDGIWYIYQSSNGQARIENFGLAGDLPRPGDFDGDGKADISVFRPSNGIWYRLNSSNGGFGAINFGQNGDVPMLGDYDADGKTDFAVFRPSNSVWYILRSSDFQVQVDAFGLNGDIPLNGDFDGDGKANLAVFRPSNRTWYIARPTGVPGQNFDTISFGLSSDVPIPADYDNDGKTDVAVYRGGTWWILQSGNNQVSATQFGLSDDKPIPAAYLP